MNAVGCPRVPHNTAQCLKVQWYVNIEFGGMTMPVSSRGELPPPLRTGRDSLPSSDSHHPALSCAGPPVGKSSGWHFRAEARRFHAR
jgi:hypothetical protein